MLGKSLKERSLVLDRVGGNGSESKSARRSWRMGKQAQLSLKDTSDMGWLYAFHAHPSTINYSFALLDELNFGNSAFPQIGFLDSNQPDLCHSTG